MEVRLAKTRIRLHPLMLMLPLIAHLMGAKADITALLISLSLHEFAHFLAARIMHVGIEEIRLMPFGGAAHIGNPYILSAAQLFITSMAGPLSNLALIFVCAAFAHWGLLSPEFTLTMLEVNLVLMLFNLLPALPLDGGRMLYALLYPSIGRGRALNIGILLGRILAMIMLVGCIYSWMRFRVLNLSLLAAPIFILSAAPEERNALGSTRIHTILNEMNPVSAPIPANIFAVSEKCTIRSALRAANPNTLSLYAIYCDNHFKRITDDRYLLEASIKNTPDTPISDV